jgi:hypothetical protein
MAYMNVDPDFFEHRKTRRLVALVGPEGVAPVLRLWAYCARFHAEDGLLADYNPEEIESLAGWDGKPGTLLEAMLKVGLLDREGEGVVIHDWKEHQGHIAAFKERGRMMAKRRWSKARHAASNAGPPSSAMLPAMLLPTVPTEPTNPTEPVCVSPEGPTPQNGVERTTGTHTDSSWPVLSEVLQRAELRGIPKDCAEKWWHEHDARGGCDRHGQPLKRWESALLAFAASWRAVDAQRKARNNDSNQSNKTHNPIDHSKGFWK